MSKNLYKVDKKKFISFLDVQQCQWKPHSICSLYHGGFSIMSSTEFHRMGSHRAFQRGSSSRSVLPTTSTNCRYIKRFVLRNFFRAQCINVKEVVWGPVETSDTRRRAIRDGQLFIAVSIQTREKCKGRPTLRTRRDSVRKIQFRR